MVASEHTEVVEGRRRLIFTDVIDSEDASEDGSIYNYGAASDEEDENGLVYSCGRTGGTQSVTEEVEEVHQVVKYSYVFSYMLKPPSLLTQGFNKNKKSQ